MSVNLETRYSYLCDNLFINFLNTINGENNVATDLLEEEGVMDNWLAFMIQENILNRSQVEKIRASVIEVRKIQAFRDQCRSYFLKLDKNPSFLEMLASYTVRTPLYFDEALRPFPSEGGTDGLISLISYDILHAYHNDIFRKIKKCNSSTCYAFFIDKNGKRKWCSMEICGNREKARKHYAKKISK